MRYITFMAVIGLIFALPAVSLAATYYYVSVSGSLKSVEALNAAVALEIAHSLDADPNSGVMPASKFTETVASVNVGGDFTGVGGSDIVGDIYQYIDISGNLREVIAVSAEMALRTAINIHPNSGVILIR